MEPNPLPQPWRFPVAALMVALAALATSCGRAADPPQRVLGQIRSMIHGESFREAASEARAALKRYPKSVRLQLLLAKAEMGLGRFDEAVKALEPAAQAGWGGVELNGTLGLAHFRLGHFEKANAFLEKAEAAGALSAGFRKKLGYARYYLRDGRGAIETFQALAEADPKDVETQLALDALMNLTGQWPAAWMVWYPEPSGGLQIAYPGGWERQRKEFLTEAGKLTFVFCSGKVFEREERFHLGGILFLSVYQNASKGPLPKVLKGPYRRGEKVFGEDGRVTYHATSPTAEPRYAAVPREPGEFARFMSQQTLRDILDVWGFSLRDADLHPWTGRRGNASYCVGEVIAEDRQGRRLFGRSLGFYDSFNDTYGALQIYGPDWDEEKVRQMSEAIFHLALFGGVVGIPPLPEGMVSVEEYQSRILGFLEKGEADRALTEAKRALTAHPQVSQLYVLLGRAHEALWHPEEAAAAYEKARELGTLDFESELALGGLRLGLGELDGARIAYTRSLSLKPSHPAALIGLGLVSYARGELPQAKELFQRACVEAPHFESALFLRDAVQALEQAGKEKGRVVWFPGAEERPLFCVPAGWEGQRLETGDPGRYEIVFSPPDQGEGTLFLTYLRYEHASSRIGRLKGMTDPQEVLDGFLSQAFDKLVDPQKVWNRITPLFQRGKDRFVRAEFAYTRGSQRVLERLLAYHQSDEDRLHVLALTSGSLGQDWSAFVEACFWTARFDSYRFRPAREGEA